MKANKSKKVISRQIGKTNKKNFDYFKKKYCFHSDIKPDNLLVKNKKLTLIDFAQSTKISNLKKNFFLKKEFFMTNIQLIE